MFFIVGCGMGTKTSSSPLLLLPAEMLTLAPAQGVVLHIVTADFGRFLVLPLVESRDGIVVAVVLMEVEYTQYVL